MDAVHRFMSVICVLCNVCVSVCAVVMAQILMDPKIEYCGSLRSSPFSNISRSSIRCKQDIHSWCLLLSELHHTWWRTEWVCPEAFGLQRKKFVMFASSPEGDEGFNHQFIDALYFYSAFNPPHYWALVVGGGSAVTGPVLCLTQGIIFH